MSQENIFAVMESWGYYLPPKTHAESPGYPELVVAMRPQPTQEHFDPESMDLCLHTPQATVERAHLTLRGLSFAPRRVCPGRITLHDRVNKRVDFYTYGATLDVAQRPDLTIYTLSSPAPILSLADDDGDSFPEELEAETERLLARHHVRWQRDDAGFTERLLAIGPQELYCATLRSIHLNYNRHPTLRTHFSYLFTRIQREIQWQIDNTGWQEEGPLLMDLLDPPP